MAIKISICGTPHSGKSVFLGGLVENIPVPAGGGCDGRLDPLPGNPPGSSNPGIGGKTSLALC